jgi:hypothetical protein
MKKILKVFLSFLFKRDFNFVEILIFSTIWTLSLSIFDLKAWVIFIIGLVVSMVGHQAYLKVKDIW